MAKDIWTDTSAKEIYQMSNKHMKRCSSSYVKREFQIKTAMKYHCTFIRTAKIQNAYNTKCWWRCGATGTFIHCCRGWEMVQSLRKTGGCLKTKHGLNIQSSNHVLWYLSKGVENLCSHKNLHSDVISALFVIAKTWCPLVGEKINCGTSRKWNIVQL